jgi:cbb3-type cytochrome oxidase subunit 3
MQINKIFNMKNVRLLIMLLLFFIAVTFFILFIKERKISMYQKSQLILENEISKAKKHTCEGLLINSILHNNINISMPDSFNVTKPVFCLYVSKKQCFNCVKEIFKYYLGLFEVLPDSSVKILSDFSEVTNRYLKAEFQIKYECASVSTNGIHKGNCGFPCFFVYNNETKSSDLFFFPPKNELKLVRKYLNEVYEKWYKKN